MDKELRRAIIVDHYQNPMNKGLLDDASYLRANTNNESCIDNITVIAKIIDGKFKDIRFDGEACAISTSATSIMIHLCLGKTVEEVEELMREYEKMLNEEAYNQEVLEELVVYEDIYMQPNRKKCAYLPFDSLKKIIEQYKKRG